MNRMAEVEYTSKEYKKYEALAEAEFIKIAKKILPKALKKLKIELTIPKVESYREIENALYDFLYNIGKDGLKVKISKEHYVVIHFIVYDVSIPREEVVVDDYSVGFGHSETPYADFKARELRINWKMAVNWLANKITIYVT